MSFQWGQQGALESKLTGMKVTVATLEQWLLYHLSPQAMHMLTIYIHFFLGVQESLQPPFMNHESLSENHNHPP